MEDKEYYSNEINLISTNEGPFQWILGLYQYHEQVNQFRACACRGSRSWRIPRLRLSRHGSTRAGPPNPDRNLQIAGALLDADAHAVFGQIDYSLSDTWKMTLGGRYTEDNKDADEYRTRAFGFFAATAGRRGNLRSRTRSTSSTSAPTCPVSGMRRPARPAWSGRRRGHAGLREVHARLQERRLQRRRDRAGTARATRIRSSSTRTNRPEEDFRAASDDEPVGVHVRLQGRAVSVDGARPGHEPQRNRFFNLDKATSMGAELETVWAVTDALVLRLNYSYLDTEIEDTRCFIDDADGSPARSAGRASVHTPAGAQRGQLLDGGELPSAPNNKVAFNANYTLFTAVGNLTLGGPGRIATRRTTRCSRASTTWRRRTTRRTSARCGSNDNRYTLIAFVNNAFDDEGFEAAGATQSAWGTQSRTLSLTAPRTYGLEVQFSFGN